MNHPQDEFEQLKQWQAFCREYNREHRPFDHGRLILRLFAVGVLMLIVGSLSLCAFKWSPGNQQAIADEYHARRHGALEVAIK